MLSHFAEALPVCCNRVIRNIGFASEADDLESLLLVQDGQGCLFCYGFAEGFMGESRSVKLTWRGLLCIRFVFVFFIVDTFWVLQFFLVDSLSFRHRHTTHPILALRLQKVSVRSYGEELPFG